MMQPPAVIEQEVARTLTGAGCDLFYAARLSRNCMTGKPLRADARWGIAPPAGITDALSLRGRT